jgi:hypothetical protein
MVAFEQADRIADGIQQAVGCRIFRRSLSGISGRNDRYNATFTPS